MYFVYVPRHVSGMLYTRKIEFILPFLDGASGCICKHRVGEATVLTQAAGPGTLCQYTRIYKPGHKYVRQATGCGIQRSTRYYYYYCHAPFKPLAL